MRLLLLSLFIVKVGSVTQFRKRSTDIDSKTHSGGLQEYCFRTTSTTSELFEARCLKNEVIVMNRAVYGRMKIGKCLKDEGVDIVNAFKNDPRFLGCSVDVIHVLDKRCSGRNWCEVKGFVERPCHPALKSYLEANYDCQLVIEEDRSCTVSVSSTAQHIMSSSSTKLSCGTKSQPWMLEAPAGQQINVSLLDFGPRARETGNQLVDNCLQYGYIVDKAAKKNVSICGLVSGRKKLIYTSLTNSVEIFMSGNEQRGDNFSSPTFLIRFEAIGCTDLVPPEDTWLRRNNNEAVVGCYSSRQTWHLRCVDNQWIGVTGNCTRGYENWLVSSHQTETLSTSVNQYSIAIVVAISFIGIGICLTIVCVGVVCWKRYYGEYRKYKNHINDHFNCPVNTLQQQSVSKHSHRQL